MVLVRPLLLPILLLAPALLGAQVEQAVPGPTSTQPPVTEAAPEEEAEPAPAETAPDGTEQLEELPGASSAPASAPAGNPLLAFGAATVAACGAAPLLGCITAIPVLGVLLSPLFIGGGMGLVGWAAGAWLGKRRIPVVPLVTAGVVGVLLSTVATFPGLVLMVVGVVTAQFGARELGSVLALGGELVALVILGLGAVATALAVGGLAAFLGRGTYEGESAFTLDLLSVPEEPSPATGGEGQEEEGEYEEGADEEEQ